MLKRLFRNYKMMVVRFNKRARVFQYALSHKLTYKDAYDELYPTTIETRPISEEEVAAIFGRAFIEACKDAPHVDLSSIEG